MYVECKKAENSPKNGYFNHKSSWNTIQNRLFPAEIPVQYEWTDLEDIISVLNKISASADCNQMFFPSGGCGEIEFATSSKEEGCIEVFTDQIELLKPRKLTFESFNLDPNWNYFRLDLHPLESSGVYYNDFADSEELIEIEPGKYVCRSYWEEKEEQGLLIPLNARLITRHFRGSFVIVSALSPYNCVCSYDAKHAQLNPLAFNTMMKKIVMEHGCLPD
jgi:hypothetical protein